MRITVKLKDVDKAVEIRAKRKQEVEYLDKIEELQKSEKSKEGESLSSTREFIDFENNMAVECCTLSQEEYDDLYLEDRNKIKKEVRKMVFPQASGDPANFF